MSNRIVGPPSGLESLHSAVENEFSRARTRSPRGESEPAATAKAGSSDAKTSRGNGKDPGLAKAAEEFESLLLAQMLRSIRETGGGGWLGSGKGLGADSTMELAETQLAKALAQRGALGLSKMLTREATHEPRHDNSAASADAAKDTRRAKLGARRRT